MSNPDVELLTIVERVNPEDYALYYGKVVCQNVDLEENDEAIEQLDLIDNATYAYIRFLTETTGEDLKWDMSYIGEVNDMVINFLYNRGIRIWHPGNIID